MELKTGRAKKEHPKVGDFGGRLRLIRKTLKLKQVEFADKLKISGPALSEIENDKYRPGFDFIVNMSGEFNINLYYLLFGEGDMFLDPTHSFLERAGKFAVNIADVRKFLTFFERSPFVQYAILAYFRNLLIRDKDVIQHEVGRYKAPEEM